MRFNLTEKQADAICLYVKVATNQFLKELAEAKEQKDIEDIKKAIVECAEIYAIFKPYDTLAPVKLSKQN